MAPAPKSCQARQNERVVGLVERAHRRRAEPQVPVHAVRHGLLLGRPRHALRPDRAVGPAVHLAHLADGAGLEPLLHQAQALFRVALVAHLRDDLVLPRRLGQGAGLGDGAGHRLLHVDVLAELHRLHRDEGVHVIGRRDEDRVDVLLLLEHHAEVLVFRGGFGKSAGVVLLRRRPSLAASLSSTSQSATMLSLFTTFFRLLVPMPCA